MEFLDAVEVVARAGAEALMPYWRTLEEADVTEKARNDLVSVADRASEDAILAEIRRRFPDHEILSEEAGRSHGAAGQPNWIIDPLDGTANFVHGLPQFAVSVAVAIDERVDFGVILDPHKGDVFRAARGHGVRWNDRSCRVSDRDSLAGSLLATGFPFRELSRVKGYLEEAGLADAIVPLGEIADYIAAAVRRRT